MDTVLLQQDPHLGRRVAEHMRCVERGLEVVWVVGVVTDGRASVCM